MYWVKRGAVVQFYVNTCKDLFEWKFVTRFFNVCNRHIFVLIYRNFSVAFIVKNVWNKSIYLQILHTYIDIYKKKIFCLNYYINLDFRTRKYFSTITRVFSWASLYFNSFWISGDKTTCLLLDVPSHLTIPSCLKRKNREFPGKNRYWCGEYYIIKQAISILRSLNNYEL